MKLTIDFETRSEDNLRDNGARHYAEHPTTEIMCLAVKVDDQQPYILIPPKFNSWIPRVHDLRFNMIVPEELNDLLVDAGEIEAHNSEFEDSVWEHRVPKDIPGLDPLPIDKLRCSAARAAMCCLPRGLDQACEIIHASQQKDRAGYAIMMKFCKPVKTRRKVNGVWQVTKSWYENPDDFVKLCRYCMQDVNAEYELSRALPNLPLEEQRIWRLDREMNRRGIRVDIASTKSMITVVSKAEAELSAEWINLTRGKVKKPTQVTATREYLKTEFGVDLPGLDKASVADALEDLEVEDDWLALSGDPRYKRLLEIRGLMAKSSTAKFQKILDTVNPDERIRSTLMYHGAGTGRWTAKGAQFQNLPSRGLPIKSKEVDGVIELAKSGSLDLFYDNPISVASACIRGMIIPAEGHRFLCADYNAIEGRYLAWLAREQHVITAYEEGKRMYCVAASGIYNVPYEVIFNNRETDPKYGAMDAIGKVIDLACGYQGSLGAFNSMAKNYSVKVPEEEARIAIKAWRDSRPATVQLWRALERMVLDAVRSPGQVMTFDRIKAKVVGKWLLIKIPSGRYLYYFYPQVENKEMPWKDDNGNPAFKECVSYWAVDGETKRWMKFFGYGGLWTENITQAGARDIMAHGMLALDAAGYPPLLTVHDEVLAEVLKGFGNLKEFCSILCNPPSWAAGCPVAAKGWEGHRYQK